MHIGLAELLTQLGHGLAYFGIWLVNILIYETIACLLWLAISYPLYVASDEHPRLEEAPVTLMRVFFVLMIIVAVLFWFCDWIRIIPLPVFR